MFLERLAACLGRSATAFSLFGRWVRGDRGLLIGHSQNQFNRGHVGIQWVPFFKFLPGRPPHRCGVLLRKVVSTDRTRFTSQRGPWTRLSLVE